MFIINIQCLVINKTITPFTLVGYELMTADSVLLTSSVIYKLVPNARSWNNYTSIHGI